MSEKVTIHRSLARLGDIDILVRDTRADGPAILCLHGRWGRGETWVDLMRRYGGLYRVIAPDQRGHGLSGKPVGKYTVEEMAADMFALLEHLEVGPVILVGHSMGGAIAGHMAARRPESVRAVALLDKSAAGPPPNLAPLESLAPMDPLTQDWPMPFQSLSDAREFIRQNQETELSCQYFMNSLVETVEGYQMLFSAQAMAANIAYYTEWYDLLPLIRCPVLLLRSGSHEAVPDADFLKMQSLLTDCVTAEVSHPDHNVHLSNPEEFYGHFDAFLRRAEARTG